jgi:hypothetical protein
LPKNSKFGGKYLFWNYFLSSQTLEKNAHFRALTHNNFDLWPKSLQKSVVLPIMDSECVYRGTVSSCRSPILFALTDFSPIMRASIVGGASPQWERAYH